MKPRTNITRTYKRHYRDNGQTTIYVEWSDGGRTEQSLGACSCCGQDRPISPHMAALLARAEREGIKLENETW